MEVQLAEHMKSRDEADEAEAHDEDNSRGDFQARSVVRVESQHVVSGT